jgi:hypothetical protein
MRQYDKSAKSPCSKAFWLFCQIVNVAMSSITLLLAAIFTPARVLFWLFPKVLLTNDLLVNNH